MVEKGITNKYLEYGGGIGLRGTVGSASTVRQKVIKLEGGNEYQEGFAAVSYPERKRLQP